MPATLGQGMTIKYISIETALRFGTLNASDTPGAYYQPSGIIRKSAAVFVEYQVLILLCYREVWPLYDYAN